MEEVKRVDEADRIQMELLWLKLSRAVAQFEKLQEEEKRISLEKVVLSPVVQKLKTRYEQLAATLKEKYGVADFDIETGLEVRPGK